MKKLIFTSLILMGIGIAAQPTVTRLALDKINVTTNVYHADVSTGTLSPGPSGAGQTWNFSSYVGTPVITTKIYPCPGQTNCSRFPTANRLSELVGSDTYDYLLNSDAEATTIGNFSGMGNVTMTYSDPLINYKFPVNYLQEFTDTYQFSTPGTTETGQQSFKVDGYGTVITPNGTFPNALRIKRIRNGSQASGGATFNYVNESYQWVTESNGPVLTVAFNTFTINGQTTTQPSLAYFTSSSTLSTVDLDSTKDEIVIYPNPATQSITIKSNEDIKNINIISLDGKVVRKTPNHKIIDVANLPNGIYIVQGELKNGKTISKKISKQ
ncbi:T9SS type A sorting domain-containing protein [Chryseobacterium sp. ISL-6]|uniref:T9SS type A sorting domain-containing protein n=1 Tax=Chryseobacterium sp. ISL-6 TaxID=2819143 RepID=UPI001BE6C7C0|nr:T9SS type A sorting domain-containing protein [Chryseobacterium sp. ISL-6]MBT2619869.1 T9SS type A sorting domain-containing protein [Chryseobacterium sp. ISL-6]